jgi:hypothetical protein
MADDKIDISGLSPDYTKLPTYDDEGLAALQAAQQKSLDALQQRYAQPNWFKVAAGFAKPQLGGFLASLGSASEALGENYEQQRQMQIPIAQMKMAIEQSNYLLKNRAKSNQIIKDWQTQNPDQTTIPTNVLRSAAEIDPNNPTVLTAQKSLENAHNQFNDSVAVLNAQRQSGAINDAQYNQQLSSLSNLLPTYTMTSGKQPTIGAAQPEEAKPQISRPTVSTDDYFSATHNLSGLKPGQQTASTATGPGDLLQSTVNDLKKNHNLPDGYGKDPAVTAQYEHALLSDNQKALDQNNLEGTALNHRTLWWFGSGDGSKILQSDPSTHLGDVLSDSVLKANNLNKNSTVGALKSKIAGQLWDNNVNPDAAIGGQTTPRTGGQAQPDVLTFEKMGLSGPQSLEQQKAVAAAREQSFADQFNHILTDYKPQVTDARDARLNRALNLMHNQVDGDKVRNAMGQLWKDSGYVNAVQNLVNDGISGGITPGDFNIRLSANVNKWLTTANVDPQTRAKLQEINRIIMSDALDDFREGSKAMGGGHINQSEFQTIASRFPSTDDPSTAVSQWLLQRKANNEFNANSYKNAINYANDPVYGKANVSHMNFFSNYKPYQQTLDTHKKHLQTALNSVY